MDSSYVWYTPTWNSPAFIRFCPVSRSLQCVQHPGQTELALHSCLDLDRASVPPNKSHLRGCANATPPAAVNGDGDDDGDGDGNAAAAADGVGW